jgi:membrane-associated protease RseP (regulator of RpoE activity)
MPTSRSSSTDSPPPYATASDPVEPRPLAPLRWRLSLVLFVATVASLFYTGAAYAADAEHPFRLADGASFALPLLAILLCHEFGHFTFARIHRVNASLPYFIPLPELSPFGTMGAIIVMRDRIRSRNALLDIGASGPLAGFVVALPVLVYGLAHSEVKPLLDHGMQEGQSLLYWGLKRLVLGRIPPGSDVYLSPTAFAGWVGMFVTMLNLVPVWQLDGGHVAYALFGAKQNRYGRLVRWSIPILVGLNFLLNLPGALRTHDWTAATGPSQWLGWFVLLTVIARFGGGADHPPTEPTVLSPVRRAIAIVTLLLFVVLLMPSFMVVY